MLSKTEQLKQKGKIQSQDLKNNKCFQNQTRSFLHLKIKHIVLQYKQELQFINNEKPV
jgi:hypothetical protein